MNISTSPSRLAVDAPFLLALVGAGPTWDFLVGILGREEFTETFPWVKLVGRVANEREQAMELPHPMGNTPVYADCTALFAAHPDIDMACDLSADGSGMADLQTVAPQHTALITEKTVRHFCEATVNGTIVIGGGARLRRLRDMSTALIDQVDEDILILDATGRVVEINQHVIDTRGGSKADFIGRFCLDIGGTEEACGQEQSIFSTVLQTGKKAVEVFTHVTEEGHVRYYRVIAFPVLGETGNTRRVVLMRSDTTAKVQLEQRLQQSEKMAAIGELSTYIAHEIRNPLFAIGGFANALLRSSSLDDNAREKVRIILEESHRLDGILKSILNFARPTEQTLGEVDVNMVAEQTIELMGMGCADRHIQLITQLDTSIPKVQGNAELLKQCVINLIKNSLEALPESGGTVTVSSFLHNKFVTLEVTDTGEGIPPEKHEQVFSPFFSTKNKGAGLGLAMTRKIIEEMGGHVGLQSQRTKGTTITLALPPVLAVEEPADTQ